ncbi:unnamed protein product [Sphagnum troendelagicum]
MCESTWGGGGVCDQGLCQRVQPHSPMGGQAPDMALDNEIEVDAQLKVGAGCRMQQRASKRAIEFEAQERKEKGLPGHKVQVTRHGKIDGACEGKDAWDGAIRSLAPRILNMAAVRVTEQDPVDMARLRLQLDGKFEYVGGELSDAGFRDCKSKHRRSPSISEMAAVGLDSSGTPGTDITWPTSTRKSAEVVPSSAEVGVAFPNSLPSDIPSLLLLVSVLEMISSGTVSTVA